MASLTPFTILDSQQGYWIQLFNQLILTKEKKISLWKLISIIFASQKSLILPNSLKKTIYPCNLRQNTWVLIMYRSSQCKLSTDLNQMTFKKVSSSLSNSLNTWIFKNTVNLFPRNPKINARNFQCIKENRNKTYKKLMKSSKISFKT